MKNLQVLLTSLLPAVLLNTNTRACF